MGLVRLIKYPFFISLIFIAVNIFTASRSPTIWRDEVMFLDPAANLASGNGFRSTYWSYQNPKKTFTANTPLYPLVLAGWVGLGKVEPMWVRSLNFFLMLGIVWMLGEILKPLVARTKQTDSRISLFYFLALCWGSIAFSYRSGRYDMLCGLLLTTTIYGFSKNSKVGALAACVAAFLCPWAGLQTCVFLGIGAIAAFAAWRTESIKPIIFVFLSAGVGLLCLIIWVWSQDGTETFIQSIKLLGGKKSVSLPKIIQESLRWDYLTLLFVCWWLSFLQKEPPKMIQKWALWMGSAVPLIFGVIGKYPVYYSFLSILPLIFFFCSIKCNRLQRGFSYFLVLATCLTGLPARCGLLTLEWTQRAPENLKKGVTDLLQKEDNVLADYPFYYAIKNAGAKSYGPQLIWEQVPAEINVVVAYPNGDLDQFAKQEKWNLINEQIKIPKPKGIFSSAQLYAWRIYRKPKIPDNI